MKNFETFCQQDLFMGQPSQLGLVVQDFVLQPLFLSRSEIETHPPGPVYAELLHKLLFPIRPESGTTMAVSLSVPTETIKSLFSERWNCCPCCVSSWIARSVSPTRRKTCSGGDQQGGNRAFIHQLPLMNNPDPITNQFDFMQTMAADKNGDSFGR